MPSCCSLASAFQEACARAGGGIHQHMICCTVCSVLQGNCTLVTHQLQRRTVVRRVALLLLGQCAAELLLCSCTAGPLACTCTALRSRRKSTVNAVKHSGSTLGTASAGKATHLNSMLKSLQLLTGNRTMEL
jgi:hypothetical protein